MSDDFNCTADEWERRVFRAAVLFRVHRFYGKGQHDSCEVATFEEAVRTVAEARRDLPGARVAIYAVTAQGRSSMLAEGRWDEYRREVLA